MKTTKKDFELFREYSLSWQRKLGLVDWAIYYYHKKISDSYAATAWEMSSAVAVITLSTEWDEGRPFSNDELNRLSLHEMLHVLLAKFVAEAEDRYSNQIAMNIAEHSVIRSLENVLLEFSNV